MSGEAAKAEGGGHTELCGACTHEWMSLASALGHKSSMLTPSGNGREVDGFRSTLIARAQASARIGLDWWKRTLPALRARSRRGSITAGRMGRRRIDLLAFATVGVAHTCTLRESPKTLTIL